MPIVYILTNTAMPGFVKIGITEGQIETRMRQLDNTSVPLPFECFMARSIEDAVRWERALHEAFGDHRERRSREFFRLSPDKPAAILRMIPGEDVTPRQDVIAEIEDQVALDKARSRKANFRFDLLGIEPGSELRSVFDDQITCIVEGPRKVIFRDRSMSLSASALEVAHENGFMWRAIPGPSYWKYRETPLSDIRQAADQEDDE